MQNRRSPGPSRAPLTIGGLSAARAVNGLSTLSTGQGPSPSIPDRHHLHPRNPVLTLHVRPAQQKSGVSSTEAEAGPTLSTFTATSSGSSTASTAAVVKTLVGCRPSSA